jgi:hypothetical protein
MPYQPIFSQLEPEREVHGSRILSKTVDLSRVGIDGSLSAPLFPGALNIPGVIGFSGSVEPYKRVSGLSPGTWLSSFPKGLSYMSTGSGSWPNPVGSVLTWNWATGVGQRSWQLNIGKTLAPLFFRVRNSDDTGWEPWVRVADSVNGVVAPNGSPTSPGVSFVGDASTGLYRPAVNNLGLVVGGSEALRVAPLSDGVRLSFPATPNRIDSTASGTLQTLEVYADDILKLRGGSGGTLEINHVSPYNVLSAPFVNNSVVLRLNIERPWEFRQDGVGAATGLKFFSTSNKSLFIGGDSNGTVLEVRTDTSPSLRLIDGSASAPAFTFSNDPDTGIYRHSTDQIGIATGGSARLLVGNSTITYNGSTVWHSANDGSGSGLDADLLDGLNSTAFALAGGSSPDVANANYDLTSRIVRRTTSTIKIKQHVAPLDGENWGIIPEEKRLKRSKQVWSKGSPLNLTPVRFRSAAPGGKKRVQLGLLAEDVEKHLPEAFLKASDGMHSIDWNAITATLIHEVKQLKKELEEVKTRLLNCRCHG